jgi:peptidyl-prolyl cis-trans isomerase A (cyclophilin A)
MPEKLTDTLLPHVAIDTPFGTMVLEIDVNKAPITAANFLAYVDGHHLEGATAYRVVTLDNQPDEVPAKIEVVQFGLKPEGETYPTPLPAIAHEPTNVTGLRHVDGTISMARFAPGTASSGYFLCVGDQPALDFGGARNPDGLGFAAFGKVVEGLDVLRAIFAQGEDDHMLRTPIPTTNIRRV